jgi:hypothetical protein
VRISLFLNNDTVVFDKLLPVLNYLKSDLKIGAVGIKMIMAIELSSSAGISQLWFYV